MIVERSFPTLRRPDVRVARHAALADPVRLAVVDRLLVGDASPSELQQALGLTSNLLAHHLKVLESAGIARRRRSQGDRRRSYVTLAPGGLDDLVGPATTAASTGALRVVFVCTANSARSQLASALWRGTSDLPVASAGTQPAPVIATGARAAAARHGLRLVDDTPRHLDEVRRDGDLVVTVCDHAHEELAGVDDVHWSVPDPVVADTAASYDAVVAELDRRITTLAGTAGRPPERGAP
ncbi:helix-turn-helix domain-containing protein [Nocardioides rubriscoriae]|uniref:arsenate reductase/protein-tyrosine-phosphatase family protein n=1 Tax=Nocardioides rubriscoriae TaxID=642762 RepID=UPI0011DF2128|nr:helix-turn-helix domain-containing protein [Nocardioides rubriscoriae]